MPNDRLAPFTILLAAVIESGLPVEFRFCPEGGKKKYGAEIRGNRGFSADNPAAALLDAIALGKQELDAMKVSTASTLLAETDRYANLFTTAPAAADHRPPPDDESDGAKIPNRVREAMIAALNLAKTDD